MNKNEPQLGKLLTSEGQRDAIHIAIIPMVAGDDMGRGEAVTVEDGKAIPIGDGDFSVMVGVVDPFLETGPRNGQRFWLFMKPYTITALRHEWEHPAFPPAEPAPVDEAKAESERWLRQFAEDNGVGFARMVEDMASGDSVHMGHDVNRYPDEDFWQYMEAYTGKRFDAAHRSDTYFSCSC